MRASTSIDALKIMLFISILSGANPTILKAQMRGLITEFDIESNELELTRLAQPFSPFDKVGRRFAILGLESGILEAWGYPVKILRNFEFSFLIGTSTDKIRGKDIARRISVTPEATVITFTHQSFVIRVIYITPVEEPGVIMLLDVDTNEPMTILASFLPVLQPMWPAGIGGQASGWDAELKAYQIREPRRLNSGFVGSPAADGVSYSPAHMFSDTPQEFAIKVVPRDVVGKFIPVIITGGRGKVEEFKSVYQKLAKNPARFYEQNRDHYRHLRENTIRVKTPVPKIDLAFEWAKVSYDNLISTNPTLGTGLVAGLGISGSSGRPGFGWYFSGDVYINSLSLTSSGAYSTLRDALRFTQKWQREDGKMAHELSQSAQSYIDWFEDYPYGYIHGDTTPWFLVATGYYYRATGDLDFIRESWPALMRAYAWSLATDQNGDGLMDNSAAGLGALEYGPLKGILTDIYLAAIWVKALSSMEELATALGEQEVAAECKARYEKAHAALNKHFWDRKNKNLSYAFNAKGKQVPGVAPWSSVGLMWELFDPVHSYATLEKINSAELTTDWGIRSISVKSQYYEPLNYNYGAVWPFLSSFVSTAQFVHHYAEAGLATLWSTVEHTFDNSLGNVTEVFSGDLNVWPGEAVHHQGFSSAGAILPLIRGLIGLEVFAADHSIKLSPHLPADWGQVEVDQIVVGQTVVGIYYSKADGSVKVSINVEGDQPIGITYSQAFKTDRISGVFIDGRQVEYMIEEYPQDFHVNVSTKVTRSSLIEITYTPSFEVLLPLRDRLVGISNSDLKIISSQRTGKGLKFTLDGAAGATYRLKVLRPENVKRVTGGKLLGDQIQVSFPKGAPGEFIRATLNIEAGK